MTLKSTEIGILSRKGSHRDAVVHDDESLLINDDDRNDEDGDGDLEKESGSSWDSMPYELVRDILTRIEESQSSWPYRKDVVACAQVCRSWRETMKNDIVKSPELSGVITFPISLKQPGTRGSPHRCFIKRDRATHTYRLYLGLTQALFDKGKFLLSARKCRRAVCIDYLISIDADEMLEGNGAYIGKLRSNFSGTKFTVYDAQPAHIGATNAQSCSSCLASSEQFSPRVPAGSYPVSFISYELNELGARGPRKMQCVIESGLASATEPGGILAPTLTQAEFLINSLDSFSSVSFFRSKSSSTLNLSEPFAGNNDEGKLLLTNKAPRWHGQLHCWCLNFKGRVTVASVKNFQLVASKENGPSASGQEHDKVVLQFGKVAKDLFTMDFQYPISAFQAFAICLSTFETRVASE